MTISDNTWDCGAPNSSDNLTVNHVISIDDNFNLTGTIIVNTGGQLTINGSLQSQAGTVIVRNGGQLIVEGNSGFINNSNILIEGGDLTINGKANLPQGAILQMDSESTLNVSDNLSVNSDDFIVDGVVNVGGNFINNTFITGLGQINYSGKCLGSGAINGSHSYCGSGVINMTDFTCIPSDSTPPEISDLPADMTLYLPVDACEISVSWTPPTATDDCYLDSLNATHIPNDTLQAGITVVTYTAKDKAGNSTKASFTITVLDNSSPTIYNVPDDIFVNADPGSCGTTVTWTPPDATDNCALDLTSDHAPNDFFPVGTTDITYEAVDPSGNSVTASFSVHVENAAEPVIDCPPDIIAYLGAGACEYQATWSEPTETTCWANVVQSHYPGDVFTGGNYMVSYELTNAAGEVSFCFFNVMVLDTISPVIIDYPTDRTVYLPEGKCEIAVDWTEPTVSDNCAVILSSDYSPDDFFPVGTTTVTYTATDEAGNMTAESFTIEVVDHAEPVISNCPSDITDYVNEGNSDVRITWDEPSYSGCEESLFQSHFSGDLFTVGDHQVNYEFIDANGNTSTCSFNIMIEDTISPVFTDFPSDITISTNESSCAGVTRWDEPIAIDNDGEVTITSSHEMNEILPIGKTNVVFTARDNSGNETKKSLLITVEDTTPPKFIFCPREFTVVSVDFDTRKATITWDPPIVQDACSEVTLSSNFTSGEAFDFGVTTVTYTAIDKSGNEKQCSFEVKTDINLPPVVNNLYLTAYSGEPIDIKLYAFDPENDEVFIKSIVYDETNAIISNIDEQFLSFTYTSNEDFYGTDTVYVTVEDDGVPVASTDTKVIIKVDRLLAVKTSSVITSNGDHLNDTWEIDNINLYPDNRVQIFDRWGSLLYSAIGYDNTSVVWDGSINQGSMHRGEMVPTGTYFYVIDLGKGKEVLSGAIEVIR